MRRPFRQLKTIFLLIFIFNCSLLQAEWEPEKVFPERNLSILQHQEVLALKNKVSSYLLSSWCSQEKINLLMDLILIEKPRLCIEIGAFTGSSILPVAAVLQFLNQGKIYAIDAWDNQVATKNLSNDDPNKTWWSNVDMKIVYETFLNTISTWNLKKTCIPLKKSSALAAAEIPDDIDFFHLDGDYSENGSFEDLELYLPKVKSGGYILLSNAYVMINGKQPKLKTLIELLDSCEMVCGIEHYNCALFKKH
jgi:predicted O-methyltransferase YrrM